MTLTEFLLARIAEDREAAERWRDETLELALFDDRYGPPGWVRDIAECEAKRRIVEWAEMEPRDDQVFSFLAAVYADHPDYQESWKP